MDEGAKDQEAKGPIITGSLTLVKAEIDTIDDHYSFMHHLKKQVVKHGWCSRKEFFEMLSNYLSDPDSGAPSTNKLCAVCGRGKR